MNNFRLLLSTAFFGIVLIITSGISVAAEKISAPEAHRQVVAGEMIILDIRSPQEWKETGIASVAVPLTMHSREFLAGFQKIVEDNPQKKIALICAVGGRSAWLQGELAKRGYDKVIDISEGMLGSKAGPGWIARGMEMKKYP